MPLRRPRQHRTPQVHPPVTGAAVSQGAAGDQLNGEALDLVIHVFQAVRRKRAIDPRMERLHARLFRSVPPPEPSGAFNCCCQARSMSVQPLLRLRLQGIDGRLLLGLVQGAHRWRSGRLPAVVPGVRRWPFARLVAALVSVFRRPGHIGLARGLLITKRHFSAPDTAIALH